MGFRLPAAALLLLLFLALPLPCANAESEVNPLICTCRCCYRGGCNAITNSSFVVSSCNECTTKKCYDLISSVEVREDTARIFESIRGEDQFIDDVALEECTIISVLEFATCSSNACKRTTTIKADCFNRDSFLMKYTIVSFVCITLFSVVFGLIKNHIPAFQNINEKYFNY